MRGTPVRYSLLLVSLPTDIFKYHIVTHGKRIQLTFCRKINMHHCQGHAFTRCCVQQNARGPLGSGGMLAVGFPCRHTLLSLMYVLQLIPVWQWVFSYLQSAFWNSYPNIYQNDRYNLTAPFWMSITLFESFLLNHLRAGNSPGKLLILQRPTLCSARSEEKPDFHLMSVFDDFHMPHILNNLIWSYSKNVCLDCEWFWNCFISGVIWYTLVVCGRWVYDTSTYNLNWCSFVSCCCKLHGLG